MASKKDDVYSFGIVIMEIVSGRKKLDTSRSEESIHLITLLDEKVKTDQLIDCKRRPQMSEIIKVLEDTKNAVINIEHNFVLTNLGNFVIDANVNIKGLLRLVKK
ncbi:hypothetical protein VPH35_057874 [Triticum aestivum]